MIKCNVTVCGIISRSAQMRTGKEGKPFMSLGINVVIPAKSGINKTVEISVAKDGGSQEELANYPVGNRVEVVGTLTFHKKGEAFYLNLSATGINTFSAGSEDSIKGDIEFRGTLGNKIEEKKDKKGNPFCVFSAFSSEKNGENCIPPPPHHHPQNACSSCEKNGESCGPTRQTCPRENCSHPPRFRQA